MKCRLTNKIMFAVERRIVIGCISCSDVHFVFLSDDITGFNGNFNESCCAKVDVVSTMAYNRRRQPPPRGENSIRSIIFCSIISSQLDQSIHFTQSLITSNHVIIITVGDIHLVHRPRCLSTCNYYEATHIHV